MGVNGREKGGSDADIAGLKAFVRHLALTRGTKVDSLRMPLAVILNNFSTGKPPPLAVRLEKALPFRR
jgi:hypothetical protein